MTSFHKQRVEEEITHKAAEFLNMESNNLSLITITRTVLSDDGSDANIFFTVIPDTKIKEVKEFLKRKRSDFREFFTKETKAGRIPTFDFVFDEGEKKRQRLDEISRDINS